MKSKMKALGVPTVREYLEMMSDAGAKMYGCKMSVDMFKLKQEDFLPCVESIVTAGDFMDMTEGAQIVFI
jgi:peroxiredoxin family protein